MTSFRRFKAQLRPRRTSQAIGLLLVGSVGLAAFTTWREAATHSHPVQAPHVVFTPTHLPERLRLEKENPRNEGELVRHEITFGPRSRNEVRAAVSLRITTNSYIEGLLDPMIGRLDGSAYSDVPEYRPVVRPIQVRGRQAVVEYFNVQRAVSTDGMSTRPAVKVMLTWIERPGVYVQLVAQGLAMKEIVKVVESLRERQAPKSQI